VFLRLLLRLQLKPLKLGKSCLPSAFSFKEKRKEEEGQEKKKKPYKLKGSLSKTMQRKREEIIGTGSCIEVFFSIRLIRTLVRFHTCP